MDDCRNRRSVWQRLGEALFSIFGESDFFGESDPHKMPPHFFWGCLHLEYDSSIRADVSKQNYTVAPRHWYINATFQCNRCEDRFCFSAEEQKAWYEEYGFYVDSQPRQCRDCRRELRGLKAIRQEYDRDVADALACDDLDLKVRVATLIDQLCEANVNLPIKIHENRKLLAKQIARRS
jgi:hypothetical protein